MPSRDNHESFSDRLEAFLRTKKPKTLASLSEVFAEKTFAVLFLLLMFIPALPAPTGGVTHIFEVITMLLSLELIVGRRIVWLPKFLLNKTVQPGAQKKLIPLIVRRIRWLERYSKPRMRGLIDSRAILPVVGLIVFVFSLTAFLAPPFSGLDTLPALGVVLLALGLILEDSLLALGGVVVGSLGVAVVVGLSTLIIDFVRGN